MAQHKPGDDRAADTINTARIVFLGAVVLLLAIGLVALLTHG